MAITWTDVTNLDASLADVPAAAQLTIVKYVTLTLAPVRWGAKLDLASTFLAAHLGAVLKRGASVVGPVASESIGDAAASYGVGLAAGMADLGSTGWGQIYRRMIRELGVIAIVG